MAASLEIVSFRGGRGGEMGFFSGGEICILIGGEICLAIVILIGSRCEGGDLPLSVPGESFVT